MTMQLEPMVNQPVIETERFDLRPARRSDLGLIEIYASDPPVAQAPPLLTPPPPPGRGPPAAGHVRAPDPAACPVGAKGFGHAGAAEAQARAGGPPITGGT